MKFVLPVVGAMVILSSTALADVSNGDPATPNQRLSYTDTTLLRKLAQGNLAEIDAGKLATEKASDQAVKDFGQHMVKDHSKNESELKDLAKSWGVDLPTAPDSEHSAAKAKLESASARSFDSQYMKDQVQDHEKDVKLLQDGIHSAENPSVREFAQQTLQVVQHHLSMAKQVHAKLPNAVAHRSQ